MADGTHYYRALRRLTDETRGTADRRTADRLTHLEQVVNELVNELMELGRGGGEAA